MAYKDPEVKRKKDKEYFARPDVRLRRLEVKRRWRNRPEVKKRIQAYVAIWNKTSKGKATTHAYRQRPEVKAKRLEYGKKYNQRSEVKTRFKIRARKARQNLSNSYIRSLLSDSATVTVPQKAWPQTLVDVKREFIRTRRALQEMHSEDHS